MPGKISTSDSSVEAKLDEIIEHLKKMDARDKLRTWGAFIRGVLSLIPLVIFVWSVWYFIQNGPALMKMIADTAASSAAAYTQSQGQGMVDQLMKEYSVPNTPKK